METEEKIEYKKTLNLPETTLAMRANATVRELEIQKFWEEKNIYNKIIENKDKSILDKFYFIGHRDSNDKPGEEIKITMDALGNFSNLPWEMNHVRRSMMRLMQIERKHFELLNSLE